MLKRIASEIRRAWVGSASLTGVAALMTVVFIASAAAIFLDARIITGVPAWLKPAKFAISAAIFCATMAWLFCYITVWPRFTRAMGWIIAFVLVLEVAIIDIQAFRGTTSHFNVGNALDGTLFSIMGAAIGVLWLASIGVLAALFRQRFAQPAWGWWLRMGMLTTVVGSALGGLMVQPTPDQLAAMKANEAIELVGAHTVGGPDGGPGIAGVGWSTQHGDLRVAHFFGLHGIQILPLLGWLISRRKITRGRHEVAIAVTSGTSYLALLAILVWQALRGQSIVAPDNATFVAMAAWFVASVLALFLAMRPGQSVRRRRAGSFERSSHPIRVL